MRAINQVRSAAIVATLIGAFSGTPSFAAPDPQQPEAPLLEVDTERSILVAKLKRGGLLRFLGHEHGVVPGAWSAQVRYDPDDLSAASIVVEIEAPSLIIDSEDARRLAGVDPDGPSESEVREIQAKMLSDEQIDAPAFPTIRFVSSTLRRRSDDELEVEGILTLHGETRQISFAAAVAPFDGGYVVSGDFEIEQRDFGIEPVSIGGVVNVANEIEVRFEVYARVPDTLR